MESDEDDGNSESLMVSYIFLIIDCYRNCFKPGKTEIVLCVRV